MKYALNLSEDNRILSATYEKYATPEMPLVDALPEGDIHEYLYIDGKFVHDPIPEPEQPEAEATTDDVLNALLGVTE